MTGKSLRLLPPRLRAWHCIGALFIATFAAYYNCLGNGLVDFDDIATLHPSPQAMGGIAAVKRLAARLREDPVGALPEIVMARPLTGLTKLADRALFGEDWWGHHLMNLLYHFLACSFAFLAAAELLGSKAGGLAAALVFCLHPAQTESVAYLAGRRDVLYGMLCLASFHLRLLWPHRGRKTLYAAVALWVLAMTAKQAAITLPLLWLAAPELKRPGKLPEQLRRHRALFLCLAAACSAVVAAHLLREGRYDSELKLPRELLWYGGSPTAQWATEPRIVAHAFKLLLWPAKLSGDYSPRAFEPSASLLDLKTLPALAFLGLLAWFGRRIRKRQPLIAFGLLWSALSYAPMLRILPTLHNIETFAEHWLYVPVFGFSLLAARAFLSGGRRFPRASWACLAALLAAYGVRTAARNRDWKDSLAFWSSAVRAQPRCGRAHGALGLALLHRGRSEQAEPHLKRAIELRPEDPRNYVNLSVLYQKKKRFQEAEEVLLKARELPLGRALLEPIWYNLGVVRYYSGRHRQAEKIFNLRTLRRIGGLRTARCAELAGLLAAARGKKFEAERAFLTAAKLDPDYAHAAVSLGLLYYRWKRRWLAVHWLERALRKTPDNVKARIYSGLAHAELGERGKAILRLEEALRMQPRSAEARLALSRLRSKVARPTRPGAPGPPPAAPAPSRRDRP